MSEEDVKKDAESAWLFKMDFSTFILSLNTTALIHLGEIPDPESRERAQSIPAAKHTIEILEIINAKTKGNLDAKEQNLLDDVIYDLKMKYIRNFRSAR
ncbi:MAG: DUF1844 domain-containing protein [Deltaproteobacteria bacterium]